LLSKSLGFGESSKFAKSQVRVGNTKESSHKTLIADKPTGTDPPAVVGCQSSLMRLRHWQQTWTACRARAAIRLTPLSGSPLSSCYCAAMRKAGLVAREKHLGLVCLLLTVTSITVSAQDQIAQPMPKNPNELLLLVQKQNRLTNADISPWHLKISVKQLDASGGVMATSQMEEFWAGPSKYKVIYTNPTGSMSEYATEKGLPICGNADPSRAAGAGWERLH
jgi:hypothetical protein